MSGSSSSAIESPASAATRSPSSALAAGGRDNGPPGLHPEYHPTYYGAFVIDRDGHDIEAVFHGF
jgi:hypothetical protein